MSDPKEVQCRCGERVPVVPSVSSRCPRCGSRLFWECSCGTLVERVKNRCPNCGSVRRSGRSLPRSHRPLRLRVILLAGLIGAFVFTAVGYLLVKVFSHSPLSETEGSLTAFSSQGGNFLVKTLQGIWLLVFDVSGWIRRTLSSSPAIPAFAILGFFVATFIAARRQNFSLHRLKRHLRRRWEEFLTKWL